MREKLTESIIPYDEGQIIRKELHRIAKIEYKPQNTAKEYFEFMNDNACSFEIIHPQSANHPWYFGMFSEKSQHVYGDCVEECLDKAIKKGE